ncbi:MAG: CPBP family intramembrane metalloprotease [Anaerolineae bacterium]|nr:CPBP family intramembrane metalloprotease [Anaerolineae bacterium]
MSTFSPYLDAARQGRSAWWIYVLGLYLILLVWLGVGSFVTLILILLFGAFTSHKEAGNTISIDLNFGGLPAEQMFIAVNIGFIPFLLAVVLVVWLAHGRSPKSLITPFNRIDWHRVGLAFVIWMAVVALISMVEFLIWPDTFRFSCQPGRYLAFLFVPLIFTPIQIAAEELFFRGYILQGMGLLTRNRLLLIGISSLLFLLPHLGNPEFYLGENVWSNCILTGLGILVFGVLLAWATLKDQTLEAALGLHAANNLFVGLLVNFEGSALTTPALVMTTHYDALFNLVMLLFGAAIFAVLMFGVFKRQLPEMPVEAIDETVCKGHQSGKPDTSVQQRPCTELRI